MSSVGRVGGGAGEDGLKPGSGQGAGGGAEGAHLGVEGSEDTAPHWVLGQVSGLEVARRRNSTLLPRPSPRWERTNVGARRSITTM